MDVKKAILGLYPDLEEPRDFVVLDRGKGPELIEWKTTLYPWPSREDLKRGLFFAAKRDKKAEFTRRGTAAMEAEFPEVSEEPRKAIWIAVNLMMANSQDPRLKTVRDLRDKITRGHEAVGQKTPENSTAEQVMALRWENM